jgi:hypothetical protein
MAMKLNTTLGRIISIPNSENSKIIKIFCGYMKSNAHSENYQNQSIKAMIGFTNFLGANISIFKHQNKGHDYT